MLLPPLFSFDIKIDKNFSIKEKEIILQCILDWQDATNQLIIFHVVTTELEKITFETDSTINILKAAAADKLSQIMLKRLGKSAAGFAFYTKNQLFAVPIVDRIPNNAAFHKVVLHEIGHCIMGWQHLEEPIGIMYKSITASNEITYADLELLIENIRYYIFR
jgi:predicted Zn-dependent protease